MEQISVKLQLILQRRGALYYTQGVREGPRRAVPADATVQISR
jgi:hypothetical protein